jgi:ATP-dependent RNA helicase RhlE
MSFESFKFSPPIRRGIEAMGFSAPRPVQWHTIPAVLAGRDVLGLAETGTGKTAAFALPILEKLLAHAGVGVRALVVAPTRELAMQIDAEIRGLARFTAIKSLTIYGGVSMRAQIDGLQRRPEIVVGCPGRLLDLMGQGRLRLDHVETLVLDEADHLFDMGFLPDIRRILSALPAKRQNLLFSATMPAEIRHLADNLLKHPHCVELSRTAPASTIAHELYPVASDLKFGLLTHLLTEHSIKSAIVFARTKHRAKRLALQLSSVGHNAIALQGNMSQPARDKAMSGFRQGRFEILVATDIASRGIDVAQVSHVINFDVPMTGEAYTHRIGRTGRAERSGKAYTFVTPDDASIVRDIERTIGSTIPRRVIATFGGAAHRRAEPHAARPAHHAPHARPAAAAGGFGGRFRSRRRRPSFRR